MHLIGSSRTMYEEVLQKVEGKTSLFMGERHRISGALLGMSQLGYYTSKSLEDLASLRVFFVHDMDFHKILRKCYVITDALISLEGLEFSQKNLSHYIDKMGNVSYRESELVLKMVKIADRGFREVIEEICTDWKVGDLSYEELWLKLSDIIKIKLQSSIQWLAKTKKTIQIVARIFDGLIGREEGKSRHFSIRENFRTLQSIVDVVYALFILLNRTRLWEKRFPFYELPQLPKITFQKFYC